jgi:hypothetical protein
MGLLAFPTSTHRFSGKIARLDRSHPFYILLTDPPEWHPRQHISHARGLRQDDPLSNLLFILAIDPQRLLNLATEAGILSKVGRNRTRLRTSLYADDAVIFLRPIKEEVATLKHLLQIFGEVTSLRTNIHKSSVAPIRCENLDLDDILYDFPAQRTSFPIKYLGLPLAI